MINDSKKNPRNCISVSEGNENIITAIKVPDEGSQSDSDTAPPPNSCLLSLYAKHSVNAKLHK